MRRRTETSLRWARDGAILALLLSLVTLPLVWNMGADTEWATWHVVASNLTAILTRIAVFTVAGAAVGGLLGRLGRRARRHQ